MPAMIEIDALMFMNAALWVIVLIEVIQLVRIHGRLKRVERQLRIFRDMQPPDDGSI